MLRRWGWVETSRGKFKHGDNLLSLHVKPLRDFVDGGPGFEIFKHNGNRHARILENPRAADLAGDALHSWAL